MKGETVSTDICDSLIYSLLISRLCCCVGVVVVDTVAAFSLLSVFAASVTLIPLYRQYQPIDGIRYYKLSLSSVVYFVCAVTALDIFGRLSDHLRRVGFNLRFTDFGSETEKGRCP